MKVEFIRFNSKKIAICVGLVSIFMYILPYIIHGEDTQILVHDNLDQIPIQIHLDYQQANPFWNSGDSSQRLLNGATPAYKGPNLKWANLPYHLFEPFHAYVILQFFIRVVAFFGMWLLLRSVFNYQNKSDEYDTICIGVAVLFAYLPHYLATSYTVPSLPLTAWAFYHFYRKQEKWIHWLVLVSVPFFTYMFMGPLFLLMIIGILMIIQVLFDKKLNRNLLIALTGTSLLYIITEYQLLLGAALDTDYLSHRSEFVKNTITFSQSLQKAYLNFRSGQYHVSTLHTPLFLLFFITFLMGCIKVISALRRLYTKNAVRDVIIRLYNTNRSFVFFNLFILLAAGVSLWYGLYRWHLLAPLFENLGILNMINWERMHWLHPLIWYMALAAVLFNWSSFLKKEYVRYFCVLIIVLQGVHLVKQAEYNAPQGQKGLTWRRFFAEEQFDEIKSYIGVPPQDYRVASLGLHPSVALFNGFYCLDGYSSNYNLEHKTAFRQVIQHELAKNDSLRDYFETWGSRCYLFSNELGKKFMWTKSKSRPVHDLDLDIKAFVDLGGKYIISSVQINRPEESDLVLLKKFIHHNSAWDIWLYKAVPLNGQ